MDTARRCGDCTLCCKLMPVSEIRKPANTVCAQQRSKGCRVHGTSAYPLACHLWSCLWLLDESLPLPRPDRARYVIDSSPEFLVVNGQSVRALQLWIDPRFPNAHRDAALRDWLSERWDTFEELAIVRFNSRSGMVLFPPGVAGPGWREEQGTETVEHTVQQIAHQLQVIKQRSQPAVDLLEGTGFDSTRLAEIIAAEK